MTREGKTHHHEPADAQEEQVAPFLEISRQQKPYTR